MGARKKVLPGTRGSAPKPPKPRSTLAKPAVPALIPARRTKRTAPGGNVHLASDFPVVGVGASAGGLEAFTQLLENVPADTGMSFVLVSHLDPTHESMLDEILGRATRMPVTQVTGGMSLQPNSVYVIPPNYSMVLSDGGFRLLPRLANQIHMPIDEFFQSLAAHQSNRAIGIVLSGSNSDGVLGLQAIKAEGGITFAQDEATAKFTEMPRAVVAAGCVDFVLSPARIGRELARIVKHPNVLARGADGTEEVVATADQLLLKRIFAVLKSTSGVDFSGYRLTTIRRRIGRRMVVNTIATLADYVQFLSGNTREQGALYDDFLITVTAFFRDPGTFEYLGSRILPALLKKKAPDQPVRIWVAGSATGEEVYSIAITVLESLLPDKPLPRIQIFATDVSQKAIDQARAGIYMENALVDVSAERRRKYFVKVDGGFQICKAIRDICIFARQNVAADPPFSNLDLLSCRNLLIYLEPSLQQRVIPFFHYALNSDGFLLLGAAETLGNFGDLFAPLDKHQRIFVKRSTSLRQVMDFPRARAPGAKSEKAPSSPPASREPRSHVEVARDADRIVLGRFGPAGVIVNENLEILQFRGRTSPFLEAPSGMASLNVLKMARGGVLVELRNTLEKARKSRGAEKGRPFALVDEGVTKSVTIEVVPINPRSDPERHLLVLFLENSTLPAARKVRSVSASEALERRDRESSVTSLERELASTKDYLQSIIEEQEASNEELKSANEEILSANEELQSTNEEMETAKEELQSTNEELTTVNEELQNRNADLATLNNDLVNLLSSVNIPIVMLGARGEIRRVTPHAEKLLNLIPNDIGRPIRDLKPILTGADFAESVAEVIESVTTREKEVQDAQGRWYLMRVRPYRTLDNRIDGAVAVFLDIDAAKRSLEQVSKARHYAETLVETIRESLIVLDEELAVQTANQAFYTTFGLTPVQVEGKRLFELPDWQWFAPKIQSRIERVVTLGERIHDLEIEHEFEGLGQKTISFNSRQIHLPGESRPTVLLAIEDVTERKKAEAELRASEIRYRQIFESAKEGIWILDGETGEILDANPYLHELLGFNRWELIGRKSWEPTQTPDAEGVRDRLQTLRDVGYLCESDVTMRTKAGATIHIESISNLYAVNQRKFVQSNLRDVTERKRFEAELREVQKMESIGRIAGGIAHDFNNILNIISAYTALLERSADPKGQSESLDAINKAVQRGAAVVRQLLTFARKAETSLEVIDVNEVLRELSAMAKETFPKKIAIEIELAAGLPFIKADPNQLHQAFLNLSVNARDAMEQGGTLTIRSGLVGGDELKDRYSEAGGGPYICVAVTDTGSGMDEVVKARIFEPFFTTKESRGGSGLGLPVVYGIVNTHGGFLNVESQSGAGTAFHVYLPVPAMAGVERALPPPRRPSLRKGSETILLVEDEELLLDSIRMILEHEGYTVLGARDGAEALELYRSRRSEIDLVLSDLELPKMGGWEAFLKMKEIDPAVALVIASGYVDPGQQEQMLLDGVRAVISKPYTAEKLLRKVREVLDSVPRGKR